MKIKAIKLIKMAKHGIKCDINQDNCGHMRGKKMKDMNKRFTRRRLVFNFLFLFFKKCVIALWTSGVKIQQKCGRRSASKNDNMLCF